MPYDKEMENESRLTRVETAIGFMQQDIKDLKDDVRALRADVNAIRTTDFRILFGAIIAVALGLAGLIAKSAHWL